MTKFIGVIGYATQTETAPGVWRDLIVEKACRGDLLQNNNRWQQSEQLNDDFVIENKLSVIADPYAYQNWHNMKYVRLNGIGGTWKISRAEILRPRILLTTGGIYNG